MLAAAPGTTHASPLNPIVIVPSKSCDFHVNTICYGKLHMHSRRLKVSTLLVLIVVLTSAIKMPDHLLVVRYSLFWQLSS